MSTSLFGERVAPKHTNQVAGVLTITAGSRKDINHNHFALCAWELSEWPVPGDGHTGRSRALSSRLVHLLVVHSTTTMHKIDCGIACLHPIIISPRASPSVHGGASPLFGGRCISFLCVRAATVCQNRCISVMCIAICGVDELSKKSRRYVDAGAHLEWCISPSCR